MPTIANSNASTQAEILAIAETSTAFEAADAAIAKTDTAQIWTAQQNFQAVAVTSTSNAVAWNLATAQVAKHALTENTTVSAPSNIVAGGTYIFIATQAAAASYSLAWNAAYVFPAATPTVRQEFDSITIYAFIGSPDGTQLLAGATPSYQMPVVADATSWTPSLDDANKIILLSNSSPITATIPANSSIPYPIGTTLTFASTGVTGTSAVTIAITTDTIIYDSTNQTLVMNLYGVASATKITATSWMVYGNLVAA